MKECQRESLDEAIRDYVANPIGVFYSEVHSVMAKTIKGMIDEWNKEYFDYIFAYYSFMWKRNAWAVTGEKKNKENIC